MTRLLTMTAAFLMAAWASPGFSLEANDTMAAWKNASAAEKGVIVDKVLKGHGASSVIKCVDSASESPGHGDLQILQMIKACDKAGNDPV